MRQKFRRSFDRWQAWLLATMRRRIPAVPLTIALACLIGIVAGYGAVLFTLLINTVSDNTVEPIVRLAQQNDAWFVLLCMVPAMGLVLVSWFTRRFAPEAQGHGVPEVITAVGRRDGVIRPRVALVKILASGICIGTGGSIGREGPIVQIGATLGSVFGQFFRLSARNIKVLVAAGAAAGISATFNAPLAGVIFASEIILGSFAVESLTPIVIASVLADVVQGYAGEHGWNPAFRQLHYEYVGAWEQLPTHLLLGALCGLAAVGFTKLLYATEDWTAARIRDWWLRAVVLGLVVGVVGVLFHREVPPVQSDALEHHLETEGPLVPPLFGVGYEVVDLSLHLESVDKPVKIVDRRVVDRGEEPDRSIRLTHDDMISALIWLLPLAIIKPFVTSLTLAGGGSGGIFAPSLFIGATLGASFGLLLNLLVPSLVANPGVYAIVGMGAVVAGTTHGVLSAILIVYEMTSDYRIILPIMAAAGVASVVARVIDPESIYQKKLSRRGEHIARGLDMHRLEDIKVRDVMIRVFPTVKNSDTVPEIIRVAREHSFIESLPVMNGEGKLIGIICPEDLHRVLDSDIPPHLLNADDIAQKSPLAVDPDENLLEAVRDFGTRDVDTLPVESGTGTNRRLVGLLLRVDVMRRYREEMLAYH